MRPMNSSKNKLKTLISSLPKHTHNFSKKRKKERLAIKKNKKKKISYLVMQVEPNRSLSFIFKFAIPTLI